MVGKKTPKKASGQPDSGQMDQGELRKQTLAFLPQITEITGELNAISKDITEAEFNSLHSVMGKLRDVQKRNSIVHTPRSVAIPRFVKWAEAQGIKMDKVRIDECPEGLGLVANSALQRGELYLVVPRKAMIIVDAARTHGFDTLIDAFQMVKDLHNIQLALFVLNEKLTGKSFWQPYLDAMPHTFNNPLYFSADDARHLAGSPTLRVLRNVYRSVCRQYAVLYKYFNSCNGSSHVNNLLIKFMTFDDYCWAVSVVMSRLNQVPSEKDPYVTTQALIPVWDFANHQNGELTSDYSPQEKQLNCMAMDNCPKDSQVYIFYGPRSCSDFLINYGFVYPENVHNKMSIQLGVGAKDPLCKDKVDVLSRLGLKQSSFYYLEDSDPPVREDVLSFIRINKMNQEMLDKVLNSRRALAFLRQLRLLDTPLNQDNELEAWDFFKGRCELLFAYYKTTVENVRQQAEEAAQKNEVRRCLANQLLGADLSVLLHCKTFAEKRIAQLKEAPVMDTMNETFRPPYPEVLSYPDDFFNTDANIIDVNKILYASGSEEQTSKEGHQHTESSEEKPMETGAKDDVGSGDTVGVDEPVQPPHKHALYEAGEGLVAAIEQLTVTAESMNKEDNSPSVKTAEGKTDEMSSEDVKQ